MFQRFFHWFCPLVHQDVASIGTHFCSFLLFFLCFSIASNHSSCNSYPCGILQEKVKERNDRSPRGQLGWKWGVPAKFLPTKQMFQGGTGLGVDEYMRQFTYIVLIYNKNTDIMCIYTWFEYTYILCVLMLYGDTIRIWPDWLYEILCLMMS